MNKRRFLSLIGGFVVGSFIGLGKNKENFEEIFVTNPTYEKAEYEVAFMVLTNYKCLIAPPVIKNYKAWEKLFECQSSQPVMTRF